MHVPADGEPVGDNPPVPAAPVPAAPVPAVPVLPPDLPGPQGPMYAPTPMLATSTQRPWTGRVRALGLASMALIALTCVLAALSIPANMRLRDSFASFSDDMLAHADALDTANLWATAAYVVSGIVFLLWLRAAWRSERSDPSKYTRGVNLATFGWIIPLANMVLGPMALRDLWRGATAARTRDLAGPSAGPGAAPAKTPALLTAFWVAYVVSIATYLMQRSATTRVNRIDENSTLAEVTGAFTGFLDADLASSLMIIVSGVLLTLVIRRIMASMQR